MQDNRRGHYDPNRQFQPYVFRPNFMKNQDGEKKQQGRKVIDWTGACVNTMMSRRFKRPLKERIYEKSSFFARIINKRGEKYLIKADPEKDKTFFQPLTSSILKAETPGSLPYLPANSVTTRFVRTATNKQKCPVYQVSCVLFLSENTRYH